MTVEAYGLLGERSCTITLTHFQYLELLSYLDTLRRRLNTTHSQDDAELRFHEAINVLNTYGLFPRDLSLHQAHRLVNGWHDQRKTTVFRDRPPMKNWGTSIQKNNLPDIHNRFCFLSATATKIPGFSPNPVIVPLGVLVAFVMYPVLLASLIGNEELATRLADLGLSLWMSNPLRMFNYVILKGYTIEFQSFGLNGVVSRTLNASGAFIGFSGLMLSSSRDTTYFLGFTTYIYGPR